MQALKAYVDQKNKWYALFNKQPNYLDLSKPADRQRIANMIDAELSPENLTCDGELPRSQVQARYRQLTTVAEQLTKLDPSVKFYEYC
jgi:hypothetical protein